MREERGRRENQESGVGAIDAGKRSRLDTDHCKAYRLSSARGKDPTKNAGKSRAFWRNMHRFITSNALVVPFAALGPKENHDSSGRLLRLVCPAYIDRRKQQRAVVVENCQHQGSRREAE